MYFLNRDLASMFMSLSPLVKSKAEEMKQKLNRAEIFYSLNGDVLTYFALLEDDKVLSFSLFPSKKVEANTDEDKLFAYLFAAMEKKEKLETLTARYGDDAETLLPLASMDYGTAKTYGEARKDLDSLIQAMWTNKTKAQGQGEYGVEWLLSRRGEEFRVDARIGKEKKYMQRAMREFLDGYASGRVVKVGNDYLSLPEGSFSPEAEEVFRFLRKEDLATHRMDAAVYLSVEDTIAFLTLIKNAPLRLEERAVTIVPPTQVNLSYVNGNIVSSFPLEKRGYPIIHGNKGYYLGEKEVTPLLFASEKCAILFRFLSSHPSFPFELVQAKLLSDLLPLLEESDLSMPKEIVEATQSNRPYIDCFVSYLDKKGIEVKTSYHLGEKEVDLATFSSTPPRRSMLSSYRLALRNVGLEEGILIKEESRIAQFLKSDLTDLSKLCRLYLDEALRGGKEHALGKININATSGEDWLSLSLASADYTPEELLEAYAAYCKKKRFVRIKGRLVLVEGNEMFAKIHESFSSSDFGVRLPLYQALKLGSYEDAPERAKELLQGLSDFSSFPLPALPPEIESNVRPYQRDGIRFLLNLSSLHMPGILSDEMGLGKSLQTIALVSQIKDDLPILVVCPKSLIYNWADEAKRWDPSLPCLSIDGPKKNREAIYAKMSQNGKAMYFVSYDTVRNDIEELSEIEFSLLILDEAQYIANALAKKSQAVKRLKANNRLVLTGTPIQNSLLDLWSIFDFLLPGYFPPFSEFKETYGTLEFKDEGSRKKLLSKIQPFMLGRKKKDVLKDLPDKENLVISLPLSDEQRKVYEAELLNARLAMEAGDGAMTLLAALTRLRQICVTPALYLEGDFESDKLDYLCDNCLDLKQNGRKAVVFSSFVSALHILEKRFKDLGLISATIEGSTPASIRLNLAKRFNESDDIDVLLVSLKAGGTGLNLIGADTVFHLDPWWNLAAEKQAEDRTHRIGQKNKVTVYKLVCKDSVEEKVLYLQQKKGLLTEVVDEASLGRALTEEDIKFLLS